MKKCDSNGLCNKDTEKKEDKRLQHLLCRAKRLDAHTKWYFSRYERWKFVKMIPVMRQLAWEEGATLKVQMKKSEGRFILIAPRYCICGLERQDNVIFDYLKGKVVLVSAKEDMVKVEIIAVFRKRRKYFL